MYKKFFVGLAMTLTLGLANFAAAEHGDDDPYDAMCQSTGVYSEVQNKNQRVFQLFGKCGEAPNIFLMDEAQSLKDLAPAVSRHCVTVWASPKKSGVYWKQIYCRFYDIDVQGNVLKTWRDKPDKTNFLIVEAERPLALTVKRYCSAKVGSPIFPHAEGNIVVESGAEEWGFLEPGYEAYLKDMKKR